MNLGRPGRRLLPLLLSCAGTSAFALWWPPAGLLALGLASGVAVLALVEARRLGTVQWQAQRQAHVAVPIGGMMPLSLALTHDQTWPVEVTLRQAWPRRCGGGGSTALATVFPGLTSNLPLQASGRERGHDRLEPAMVAWTAWHLWERSAAVGSPTNLDIIPDLIAIGREQRRLDALFLRGLGARLAPRRGQGRDFDRLRDAVIDDDLRHMDWKATARRGRGTVREFRVERAQDVLICVDRGFRMGVTVVGKSGPLMRLDHALNAALLTAWLAHRSEDRVGLLTFADGVDAGLAPARGQQHLAALTAAATRCEMAPRFSDYRALATDLRLRLRQRTLILIITVLPEEGDESDLLAAINLLLPRHLPLVLALADPLLEHLADQAPHTREQLTQTLVAGSLIDARRSLTAELIRRGALVATCCPDDAPTSAVNAYLDVKRKQLL